MDTFLELPATDRVLAFEQAEAKLGLPAQSIEKDFWVCYTLRALFSLPDWQQSLSFKGGTSLSKGYKLIRRFSEDIDLVIDRPFLGMTNDTDPYRAPSRKQQDARLKRLMDAAVEAIHEQLLPALNRQLEQYIPADAGDWELRIDPDVKDQQTLVLRYPSVLDHARSGVASYIRRVVRVELGARSDTEPVEVIGISPDLSEVFPDALVPSQFAVRVVSPRRTFLEKVMLLHEQACRRTPRPPARRLSRHYYDVFCLIQAGIAADALAEPDLLQRVIEHRRIFFSIGLRPECGYDGLTATGLQLLPKEQDLPQWRADYEQMRETMFYGSPPDFDELMRAVGEFQEGLRTSRTCTPKKPPAAPANTN